MIFFSFIVFRLLSIIFFNQKNFFLKYGFIFFLFSHQNLLTKYLCYDIKNKKK